VTRTGGGERGGAVVGSGWQSVRRSRFYGRWPRYAVGLTVIFFVALGVRSAFGGETHTEVVSGAGSSDDVSVEEFACEFARAYLSYDASRPGIRERALAPFVGEALSEGGGFSPRSGSRDVEWVEVASDQAALTGGRVVTVAAGVSGRPQPIYLAVTVRHRSGRPLSLGGYPSIVGAPAVSSAAPVPAGPDVEDSKVRVVVERVLRNYLAGDAPDLKADLTPAAQVTLPTLDLRLRSLEHLEWVDRSGSGAVLATVEADDETGAGYTLAYELGVVDRERPYVDFVEVVPTDG
jgi:Conjugative transposon protein TcpC